MLCEVYQASFCLLHTFAQSMYTLYDCFQGCNEWEEVQLGAQELLNIPFLLTTVN